MFNNEQHVSITVSLFAP